MRSRCSASTTPTAKTSCGRSTSGCGEGLENLQGPVPYVAELKIDGLSIALQYRDGRLIRGRNARGRHDWRGRHGKRQNDQGHSTRRSSGGPKGTIEIRGEVYLPRKEFERTNNEREEAGEPRFANPRNAAAGAMRQIDPQQVRKRGLRAFLYQLVGTRGSPGDPSPSCSSSLKGWGLPVEPHWKALSGIDDVADVLPRVGRETLCRPARPAVRHRRGRRQARQHRLARQARRDVEVSAMGRRLQVPARAGRDCAAEDRGQRRADWRRHAVCRARAGVHRGNDGVDGHAPQRQRSGAKGRSGRRSRDRREGRRHHPAGRPRREPGSCGPRRRAGRCRRTARAARARSCVGRTKRSGAARTRRAPRSCNAASSTSRRATR